MKAEYIVTSIENNIIMVSQEKHRNGSGTMNRANLEVINPHNFPLRVGSKIRIGLPQKAEALNGIFALFIPVLAALAGSFFSSSIADFFHIAHTETIKAACFSGFFLIACSFILVVSRSTTTIVKLQITSVLEY